MPIRSIGYDLGREDARKEIRAAQAKALRIIEDKACLIGWDDGSAQRYVYEAIKTLDAATRAPRRAVKKGTL